MTGRSFHENFPVTAFLLLFIVAFFALELIEHHRLHGSLPGLQGFGGVDGLSTYLLGSVSFVTVKEGQVWRLLAAAFIHGGYIHIAFSAWILYDIGRFCEPLLSPWKFLTAYVICALAGSLASIFWHAYQGLPGVGSVGASGALCGLIGLMLVYSVRQRHRELRDQLVNWIVFLLIFSVIAGGGIDHAGHAGGFVAGCLLGLTARDYMTSHEAARWRYPGYVALTMLLLSLGTAVWHYFAGREQF